MIAWSGLASRLNQHAASLLQAIPTQRHSAKLAYLRASNYHRTAYLPLYGYSLRKNAVMPNYKAMRANFASAAKLFDPPMIPQNIPFNGVKMRGYLANPPDTYRNDRLMVMISGAGGRTFILLQTPRIEQGLFGHCVRWPRARGNPP